jgi:hypothetical protein
MGPLRSYKMCPLSFACKILTPFRFFENCAWLRHLRDVNSALPLMVSDAISAYPDLKEPGSRIL